MSISSLLGVNITVLKKRSCAQPFWKGSWACHFRSHSQWELRLYKRNIYICLLAYVMIGAQPPCIERTCAQRAQPTQLGQKESRLDDIRWIYILLHVMLSSQLRTSALATHQTSYSEIYMFFLYRPRDSPSATPDIYFQESSITITICCFVLSRGSTVLTNNNATLYYNTVHYERSQLHASLEWGSFNRPLRML